MEPTPIWAEFLDRCTNELEDRERGKKSGDGGNTKAVLPQEKSNVYQLKVEVKNGVNQ